MVYRPTARTRAAVLQNVTQGITLHGFKEEVVQADVDLGGRRHQEPCTVMVRKDIAAVLQQLVLKCPIAPAVDDKQTYAKFPRKIVVNGQRVVNELWTADMWLDAQVSSASAIPSSLTECG
jgi:hypothetical protein